MSSVGFKIGQAMFFQYKKMRFFPPSEKIFYISRSFVIGFKQGNPLRTGENIQIVKMELWGMEKG